MPTVEQLLASFAGSIFDKVQTLKLDDLTGRQKRNLLRSISFEIKHATDVLMPDNLVPRVSEGARAASLTLEINLSDMDWFDQANFDPGRKVFHLTHIWPVLNVRTSCLSAGSNAAVTEILQSGLQMAWILKTERTRLRSPGPDSSPADWEAAYKDAGITLA